MKGFMACIKCGMLVDTLPNWALEHRWHNLIHIATMSPYCWDGQIACLPDMGGE